jgi:hypothetical protein
MRRLLPALVLPALLCAGPRARAEEGAVPAELGHVAWLRDLDVATARARAEEKPLLILFQEVPG